MKKVTINVSNKWFYTSLALVVIFALAFGVYAYTRPLPNPGHGADTVWVLVNGQEMTLQQAIDQGKIAGGVSVIKCSFNGNTNKGSGQTHYHVWRASECGGTLPSGDCSATIRAFSIGSAQPEDNIIACRPGETCNIPSTTDTIVGPGFMYSSLGNIYDPKYIAVDYVCDRSGG